VIVRGRLIEDALVEFQPAQLAVDVVHGIAQVDLSLNVVGRPWKWRDGQNGPASYPAGPKAL
jgi:hypothetical protein